MVNPVRRRGRLIKEVQNIAENPPWGVTCGTKVEDVYDVLTVRMRGPEGSPYESGLFELEINIPELYPCAPPVIKFITPIRHPNIDKDGRICMDALTMAGGLERHTSGDWSPAILLRDLLINIQAMLTDPNVKDPLRMDIAEEFKQDYEKYLQNTRKHTEQYAKP